MNVVSLMVLETTFSQQLNGVAQNFVSVVKHWKKHSVHKKLKIWYGDRQHICNGHTRISYRMKI